MAPPEFDVSGKTIAVMPFRGDDQYAISIEAMLVRGVLHAEQLFQGRWLNRPNIEKTAPDLAKQVTGRILRGRPVVVTRSRLLQVVQEQDLQLSNLMNADTAIEVGMLVGAEYLLMGEVTYRSDKSVWFYKLKWAQLINVQTGQVSWAYVPALYEMGGSQQIEACSGHAAFFVGRTFFWHIKGE